MNPYEPPNPYAQPGYGKPAVVVNRTPSVVAALGAFLVSGYWAALTLLLAFGAATRSTSGFQVILPAVLIGLYAYRGYQIFKGDPRATQRIIWLHAIGAVSALVQMASSGGILVVLQGIKILINVFGALTAWWAHRSLTSR